MSCDALFRATEDKESAEHSQCSLWQIYGYEETPSLQLRAAEKLAAWAEKVAHFIVYHWLLVANVAMFLFLVPPFLAPLLSAAGAEFPARAIYTIYRLTCHQMPERSFFIFGKQVAFCARCSAIYLSFWGVGFVYGLWGILLREKLAWPPLSLRWILVLLLPMALDGTMQFLGLRESTNLLRAITGTLAGSGFGLFIYPTLETGFREAKKSLPSGFLSI